MKPEYMKMTILLPFKVFMETDDVTRIVIETANGSYGLYPRRLDCVAALVPGILVYETAADGEAFAAIDEGVLIKTGLDVSISVRNAIGGKDLAHLRDVVEEDFMKLNEREQLARSAMSKMETRFLRRLKDMGDE